jgi:hypothetical protein
VKVAGHARDDLELLKILFAEDRHVRQRLDEELCHHGGDPLEVGGAETVLQADGRGACQGYGRGGALRIHLVHPRRENQVGKAGQLTEILLDGARVGGKVLVWSELCRVDEDRRHDPVGLFSGQPREGEMAFMQRAHGRHEGDAPAGAAPIGDRAPEGFDSGGGGDRHRLFSG